MSGVTVLLSGGLDSSTLLRETLEGGFTAHALAVDYGQRHIVEIAAAQRIADWYVTPLEVVRLPLGGLGSALTGQGEIPDGHYSDASMAATVVPNRNAILLAVAAGYAAARGDEYVATAVHAGDHPVYADCRPEFIRAMDEALSLSCGVRIRAPFLELDKCDIAELAVAWGVPIDMTWSCYRGGELHCGRCGTCVERAEALHFACDEDPTLYEDGGFWRAAVQA